MQAFFVFLALLFVAQLASAQPTVIRGKVVKVVDGDSIHVRANGVNYKLRLAEIDCPERGQPYGNAAKRFVLNAVGGEQVIVEIKTKDRYGRHVSAVTTPNSRSLGRELVRNGLAWWYRRYSSDSSLGELERQARNKRIGLWQEPNPMAPWEWRRTKKE